MFNLDLGFINQLFQTLRINRQPWLTSTPLPFISNIPIIGQVLVKHFNANYAFMCIIFVEVWYMTPFVFIVLLAGLRSLPAEPFEAAKIDGANVIQMFQKITLPLLRPVILVVLLLRLIGAMKAFEGIWALFGSAVETRTLNIHIYTVGAVENYYSRGAALSVILLLISIGITIIYNRIFYKE
jgi:multiple sugar transport system permease protein